MRYNDIADVRNRGRRESFGPRNRTKINDLRFVGFGVGGVLCAFLRMALDRFFRW